MMEVQIYLFVIYLVVALVGGVAAGYFLARFIFKRELKKNPPVNEKMIRVMLTQMGRKPSEKQVREKALARTRATDHQTVERGQLIGKRIERDNVT